MSSPDAAVRAIRLLIIVRDEIEMAARAPGELVAVTRPVQEQIINDLAIAARLIRELAERAS
jgi:hypothetical protein